MDEATHPRPWLANYPEGIDWRTPLDLTPVHERILRTCAETPDAVALDFLGAQTRFGELGQAIEAFAGALQSRYDVKKGSRVALLLPNTPFYVIAYFGVLRAGGTVVNCNPLYTVAELAHIVGNSGAELLITLDLKVIFEKAEALIKAGRAKHLIAAHFPDALPTVKRVLFSLIKRKDLAKVKTSPVAEVTTAFADLLALGARPTTVAIDPQADVAVQQYTGGTTGQSKGALLTHANIAANMSQIDAWGLGLFTPPDKIVAVLPFFHIFAMTVCLNVPLCGGATVVMMPRFELKGFLALLKRTRANIVPAVPTLIQALSKVDRSALAPIEVMISGGAPLPAETRANFAKVSDALVAEGYGLTEASPVVCCAALRVPSKPMSVGMPLPGTDLRFIDVETGAAAEIGARGEVQVRGAQVMLGYYRAEEATKTTLVDGWLRTGDVGYVDADGYVFLVDRIKDLIISSGFNVYPRVIEEAVLTHPAVDEVTVIGVPDEYRGEAAVAFVKLRVGQAVDEAGLMAFLADRLNKLEMPREIFFRDQLPKTLVGKLSKKELRDDYAASGGKRGP